MEEKKKSLSEKFRDDTLLKNMDSNIRYISSTLRSYFSAKDGTAFLCMVGRDGVLSVANMNTLSSNLRMQQRILRSNSNDKYYTVIKGSNDYERISRDNALGYVNKAMFNFVSSIPEKQAVCFESTDGIAIFDGNKVVDKAIFIQDKFGYCLTFMSVPYRIDKKKRTKDKNFNELEYMGSKYAFVDLKENILPELIKSLDYKGEVKELSFTDEQMTYLGLHLDKGKIYNVSNTKELMASVEKDVQVERDKFNQKRNKLLKEENSVDMGR